MSKIIIAICLVWSVLVLMIGYPSLRLPDGEVWIFGLLGLVVLIFLPWAYPALKYRQKR